MKLLNCSRDGYVKASDLDQILVEVAGAIIARMEASEALARKHDAAIRALRKELEAERRFRLARQPGRTCK